MSFYQLSPPDDDLDSLPMARVIVVSVQGCIMVDRTGRNEDAVVAYMDLIQRMIESMSISRGTAAYILYLFLYERRDHGIKE